MCLRSKKALSEKEKWNLLEEKLREFLFSYGKANEELSVINSMDFTIRNDLYNEVVEVVNSWGHNLEKVSQREVGIDPKFKELILVLEEEHILVYCKEDIIDAIKIKRRII